MKKILALWLVLFISLTYAFAGNTFISVIPLSKQHIFYEDYIPKERFSNVGIGLKASHYFNTSSNFAFGCESSFEFFNYEDFYSFYDIKLSGNCKVSLENFSGERLNTSFILGVGSDIVEREDKDLGCYFLVNAQLEASYKVSEKFEVLCGLCGASTFQKGSWVLHLNSFIGINCPERDN